MKVLHLTLKKKWFDMIASGEKKEEYREIKPYWRNRLLHTGYIGGHLYRQFDLIRFANGYSNNAPSFDIECKGITIGEGKAEWGAEAKEKYFIIELGELLNAVPNLERSVATTDAISTNVD